MMNNVLYILGAIVMISISFMCIVKAVFCIKYTEMLKPLPELMKQSEEIIESSMKMIKDMKVVMERTIEEE